MLKAASARPWLRDLLALVTLVGLAALTGGFLLRNDLFIYGDHPGQFIRFWSSVSVSPHLLGWNPVWYAGYPELQFYPPGFVLLGWGLDLLTLRQLPVFFLYQSLVFLAYLLPALSAYALARTVSGSRWVGLVTGLVTLFFSELWGGAGAVFVGLLAERLAFGLAPLVLLAGWKAMQARHPGRWWAAAGLALAAVALMHPFHAVAPVVFLVVAALVQPRRWANLRDLALAGMLALALVAFWLLPLTVHVEYAAPMIRATLGQTLDWLSRPGILSYLAVGLLLSVALLMQRTRALAVFVLSAWATVLMLVALVLLDHLVLFGRLHFYLLDPVRFVGAIYLLVVLTAGLGLGHLPGLASRGRRRWPYASLGALALAGALIWLGQPLLALVREQQDPQRFLSRAQADYPLDDTWQHLRSGEGRVLFTSYSLQVGETPTSLKAATPYFIGRTTVGGTFSHWSPVARFLWVGRPDADLLPERVELTDDVSLAGRDWAEWTDAEFFDLCHRLYVTTVVTTWSDWNARTFLDTAPHFRSDYSNDLFVVYRVLDSEPGLVEADLAAATLLEEGASALRMRVSGAGAGAILHVSITDYPLWEVTAGDVVLPHHADDLGLMAVPLPAGTYDVDLRYRPGTSERVGAWISLAAAALWVALLGCSLRRSRA